MRNSTQTERTRRWRRRKLYGKVVVPIELNTADVAFLVHEGILDPKHRTDRAKIGEAFMRWMRYR
jgi:hypothetical protein